MIKLRFLLSRISERLQHSKNMAKNTIKVKDNPTLVRDSYSKAIINTDVSAYNAVCHRRNVQAKHEETIEDLYNQIEELNFKLKEMQLQIVSLIAWKDSGSIDQIVVAPKKSKSKATQV